ncbi:MAG: sigma 54-interacting transcriptional regulator, partial [Pseudomonadota bacterium]
QMTKGRIERAHGGTLFLDEIGDLPLLLQPKILRFLQEHLIQRLGSGQELHVDVRIICATHRPLKELMGALLFREDLFYRISELVVEIPALRERGHDAVLLAKHFCQQFALEHKRPIKGLKEDALMGIQQYAWPGNIRELENFIKRAVIMAEHPWIGLKDLGLPETQAQKGVMTLRQIRDQTDREAILSVLNLVNQNVSRAAELLGVTRPTLYNLIEKLGIRSWTNEELTTEKGV